MLFEEACDCSCGPCSFFVCVLVLDHTKVWANYHVWCLLGFLEVESANLGGILFWLYEM